MSGSLFQTILANYHWQLSLMTVAGIALVSVIGGQLFRMVPTFNAAHKLNKDAYDTRMQRPIYAANQKWNRKWSVLYLVVIFGLIIPFCLTTDPRPWWRAPVDILVILFVYDFVYYLSHRFLFHDNGFLGGPLVWMHALHHQQHNPCRMDSSYIHPLEVAIGLGLYVATIFVLSRFMGSFPVPTVVLTWVAFSQINLHNHDLWEEGKFPFGYLNYASKMHHNHHGKFTGGNYATITLLYDWMFGTLDHGQGWKKAKAQVRG